jgi:hypothetical protein
MSHKARVVRLVVFLAAALAAASIAATRTSSANAWAWDPHVIINGSVSCPWTLLGDHVQWAWVSASDGEAGWAYLGPESSSKSRYYAFDFWRIGTGGAWVTVTYGCSAVGQRSTSFGVNRPAVGNYASRNIYGY